MSEQRRLVEQEGRIHAVHRGRRGALHFENMPRLLRMLEFILRTSFTRTRGVRNALDVRVEEVAIALKSLPAGFNGTRVLFITDLHIDGMDSLAEKIIGITEGIDYDFCILGGDYSFTRAHQGSLAYSRMSRVATKLQAKSRVFAILGNHDRYSVAQLLEQCGAEVLVNDNVCLEKNGDKMYLAGLDDCHYYGADDIESADAGIENGTFKMMVCHSPAGYEQSARAGYSLYLAGHTHGGQICLPGGIVVVRGATVPGRFLKGKWRYNGMCGYTSRGAGASGVAVRYFCPPEITLITLTKE
ncbi:MAG: metallophosphoesterase [Planctomycetota bacterium]